MRIKPLYTLFILFLLFGACSKYEKLLKSDNYDLKYRKALEFYNNKEWIKASALFENIQAYFKGTDKTDSITFYMANCEYWQGEYILAGYYFEELFQLYPKSVFAEEAEYMFAYCYYKSSPRPSLDQTNSKQAIEAFMIFLDKYPNTSRAAEVNKLIMELRDKLIEKSYNSARLYYNLEDYKASIVALNNSLMDFPDTKYREEILFLILKSSYLLAENSISSKKKERYQNTVDSYYSFIEEYPKSNYAEEARELYDKAQKNLNHN